MTCIIDSIVEKKSKAYIIYEDKNFIAFLDHRPVFHGHTLLCPKEHIATFYDLPETMMADFFSLAKKIGRAVEQGMNAEGSFIAINNKVSQSIPHLHLHIIPRKKGDGLKGFFGRVIPI